MKIKKNKKNKHAFYKSIFRIDWAKVSILLKERFYINLKDEELFNPNYIRDVFFKIRENKNLFFAISCILKDEITKLNDIENL